MAKIKVNASRQRIALLNREGFVSRTVTYSKISGDEMLEYAALNSGINQGQLAAAMFAIQQSFQNFLMNGHSVELPGVGTFRVGVNAHMVEHAEDVVAEKIYRRKVLFVPSKRIKAQLSNVNFTTSDGLMTGEDEIDRGVASPTSANGTTAEKEQVR